MAAKVDKQSFYQKYVLGMTLLHAQAHYNYIVYVKSVEALKALIQVDSPVYALAKHKQNPYLKAKCKKLAKFTASNFFIVLAKCRIV